jgi:hypothetical protein
VGCAHGVPSTGYSNALYQFCLAAWLQNINIDIQFIQKRWHTLMDCSDLSVSLTQVFLLATAATDPIRSGRAATIRNMRLNTMLLAKDLACYMPNPLDL